MTQIDAYEFNGEVFSIGDRVRVMTTEEAIAQYGMNDEGYPLVPSGAFDYARINKCIGGIEFTITGMYDDGEFMYSDDEPYYDALNAFMVDAEICIKVNEPNIKPDLDEKTLFQLIGGD